MNKERTHHVINCDYNVWLSVRDPQNDVYFLFN